MRERLVLEERQPTRAMKGTLKIASFEVRPLTSRRREKLKENREARVLYS